MTSPVVPEPATEHKPRLVFLQWDHSALPDFAQLHMRLHVKCLAHFFDLVVVTGDCDFQQVCDRYEPDAVLFESGVNYNAVRRPTIQGCRHDPGVPRIALHNGDPWATTRSGLISDMEEWGIDTVFSIATTLAEHTPDIADRIFVWPNFIDGALFRDYGAPKVVPVLITGMVGSLYPWRQRIAQLVARHYPTLTCPHLGYDSAHAVRMLHGEAYARTINASCFVPACGTVAREVLRKHLEIPGARSCLVTERSATLEAAGFTDMRNCVFAEPSDVLDKLDFLFAHPEELGRITDEGHRLVHGRHTLEQRPQIAQWVQLRLELGPHGHIVQEQPFGPLTAAVGVNGSRTPPPRGDGQHLAAIRRGDRAASVGDPDGAIAAYQESLNFVETPEACLGLARSELRRGNVREAQRWLRMLVNRSLEIYGSRAPDPVEWAYTAVAALCAGDVEGAAATLARFPHLRHPELDRVRWALELLPGPRAQRDDEGRPATLSRGRSVHVLPESPVEDWQDDLCRLLERCGQPSLAAALRARTSLRVASGAAVGAVATAQRRQFARVLHRVQSMLLAAGRRGIRSAIVKRMLRSLQRIESRYGYFLPYRFSAIGRDDFVVALSSLFSDHDVRSAAVLGASAGSKGTEAVLRASRRSRLRPVVHLVNRPTRGFRVLAKRCATSELARIHLIAPEHVFPDVPGPSWLESPPIAADLLLVDAPMRTLPESLLGSRFVAIDRIESAEQFHTYHALLDAPFYRLIELNPTPRRGYAIFERRSSDAQHR